MPVRSSQQPKLMMFEKYPRERKTYGIQFRRLTFSRAASMQLDLVTTTTLQT